MRLFYFNFKHNAFIFILYYMTIQSAHCIENEDDVKCGIFREKFANASSQFTLCAIDNSRPITLCEKCVNAYADVLDSFQNMSKAIDNGTSCFDKFVNQDRLNIVQILYDNSVDLWTRAKCNECYDSDIMMHNLTVSNKTLQFQTYYEEFYNCTTKNKSDDDVCSECMKDYVKLDNYYKTISNINEKIGVCMDIVDIMNTTWTFWSNNCCKYRRHDEYIFIGSSVGVLIFTILFYFILLFCKQKNAPTIIQQSRFFESLNIFRD